MHMLHKSMARFVTRAMQHFRISSVATLALAHASTTHGGLVVSWPFDQRTMNSSQNLGSTSLVNTVHERWARGATKPRKDRSIRFRNFDSTANHERSGQEGIGLEISENEYESLAVTWKHKVGARGSAWGKVQYSVGSSGFVSDGLLNEGVFQMTRKRKFMSMACDLAAIGALPAGTTFRLQIVAITHPVSGAYETVRGRPYRARSWWAVDNIVLTGTSVYTPSPGVLSLGIIASCALGNTRRRCFASIDRG
jgi:hypothetical protein